jgi:alanine-glyoxylate transaminase/serine-glyoxylate transaminase/serine-pyruvate transaminase
MTHQPGRHFLQIPGPTNTPLPILAAIARPTIDHRGPEFGRLGREVLTGIRTIFKTSKPVIIYPASGTGAWEAALVNTMSPGDKVLMFETGWFATLWSKMAGRLGIDTEFVAGDWRSGAKADAIEARLVEDKRHAIKAVAVVHNETSTGAVSNVAAVRRALDRSGHPALLLVDTISSLASIDYRHDEWGVDVTVGGSQKGLMLPPGLSFNAISDKALAASKQARLPRSFWDWEDMIAINDKGFFPYTPSTNLLQGSRWPSTCCTRRGSTTCSPAMTAPRRRPAGPCVTGVSRSSARTRPSTRRRSRRCVCPRAIRPTTCARRSSPARTYRWGTVWDRWPIRCSASGI